MQDLDHLSIEASFAIRDLKVTQSVIEAQQTTLQALRESHAKILTQLYEISAIADNNSMDPHQRLNQISTIARKNRELSN